MLNQFYAEDATAQRNYFLTFDENGFYMTLKRRVAAKLKSDDTGYTWKSKMIHDINLVILFLSIVFAARSKVVELWILFNVIAAFSLALSVSFAHNFIHKADNWRMYSINLSMCSWRGMRVTHILVNRKLKFFKDASLRKLLMFSVTVSSYVSKQLR